MANAALNAPPASGNLLALVQKKAAFGRGDVGYADTSEANTVGGTTVTATVTYVVNVPFSANPVGNQPLITNGAWGLVVSPVGSQVIVGTGSIFATNSTATNSTDLQLVGATPAVVSAGQPLIRLNDFVAQCAAPAEPQITGLSNVLGLVLVLNITGTGTCKVNFVAVGNA